MKWLRLASLCLLATVVVCAVLGLAALAQLPAAWLVYTLLAMAGAEVSLGAVWLATVAACYVALGVLIDGSNGGGGSPA